MYLSRLTDDRTQTTDHPETVDTPVRKWNEIQSGPFVQLPTSSWVGSSASHHYGQYNDASGKFLSRFSGFFWRLSGTLSESGSRKLPVAIAGVAIKKTRLVFPCLWYFCLKRMRPWFEQPKSVTSFNRMLRNWIII